jgi:hypothetical protein
MTRNYDRRMPVERLAQVVRSNEALMDALAICRDLLPVTAYIGAGAVRNSVWDHTHGRAPGLAGDVDVVFFDAAIGRAADGEFQRRLEAARPDICWDVANQAHVHSWYRDCFGKDVPALASLAQGIGTWPDTATAIAVRLDQNDKLELIAPFGLDDLFGLALRWNPARVGLAEFERRIAAKRWLERWPRLRVIGPASGTARPGNR